MPNTVKCIRYKFVPMHTMKAYRGSGCTALPILNLNTRCEWLASRPDRSSPGNELQYRLDGKHGATQPGWTLRRRDKSLPLAGFQPWIVQFVA
jgi:hypothetical protein